MTSTKSARINPSYTPATIADAIAELPLFPNFKPLKLSDKALLERLFNELKETSSDFNFNSIYAWDTRSHNQVCGLGGNLVFKLTDYLNGEPFYTILGNDNVETHIQTILEHLEAQGIRPYLKLISQTVIDALPSTHKFEIVVDGDNTDYIFSLAELARLEGKKFKNKRKAANKCANRGHITIENPILDPALLGSIVSVLKTWEADKKQAEKQVNVSYELTATKRLLEVMWGQQNIVLTIARDEQGEVVGYSIDELVADKYVLSHYFKTVEGVTGLSEYLNQQVAQKLYSLGYEYWNWEQDLGLESLREAKLHYHPCGRLPKYILKPHQHEFFTTLKLFIRNYAQRFLLVPY